MCRIFSLETIPRLHHQLIQGKKRFRQQDILQRKYRNYQNVSFYSIF